jgi:hypothetical protein
MNATPPSLLTELRRSTRAHHAAFEALIAVCSAEPAVAVVQP